MKKDQAPRQGRPTILNTEQSTRAPRQRRLSITLHAVKDRYELRAECGDELTSFTILNPGNVLPMPDPANLGESAFARALAAEHMERCASCQRGARRSA